MTTLIRAASPAELLGLVPSLAGCTPQSSLVVLPFHRRRVSRAMRVDLPRGDVSLDEYIAHLLGLLCRIDEVTSLALVVYHDAPLDRGRPPWSDLVFALTERAGLCGLRTREALCVGADAWADYFTDPTARHALSEIPAPPDLSQRHQFAGAELPEVDGSEAEAVRAARRSLSTVLDARLAHSSGDGEPPHPQAIAAASAMDDVTAFFERMLEDGALGPYESAGLAWCLATPLLRDAAIIQWATSRGEGARALGSHPALRDRHGSAGPDDLALLLMGHGPRPDPSRLRRALDRVRAVAALVAEPDRPGLLVAAGWLSWALGLSTHATAHLDQALSIDPHHSMAGLLRTLIDAVTLPAWVFGGAADDAGPRGAAT